jgi:GNAT superfamily N-acetyltransferase
VVIDDKTVVGWIHGFHSLTVEYDPCVEIGGLVIDINHRRKGIGQMLVNEVIAWSRSIGMNRIRVRSNTIRNDAHSFYLGIGFIQIKEQKVFDLLLK